MSNFKGDKQAKFQKVVQLALLPGDVERIMAWNIQPEERFTLMEILHHEGYSIETSYDQVADQWSCCIKGKYERNVNAGMYIYGNAPDYWTAIDVALWKVTVKLDGKRWEEVDTQPNRNGIY